MMGKPHIKGLLLDVRFELILVKPLGKEDHWSFTEVEVA